MHPLGIYFAIRDGQREYGLGQAKERRAAFPRGYATPIAEPEPVSRIGRLAATVRRRVLRSAGA